VGEMHDLGSPRRRFHLSFEPVSATAASDSASCLRTASTVNREIGIPSVVFVCGGMNSTVDSILSGIPKPQHISTSGLNDRGYFRFAQMLRQGVFSSRPRRKLHMFPIISRPAFIALPYPVPPCFIGRILATELASFSIAMFNRLIRRIHSAASQIHT